MKAEQFLRNGADVLAERGKEYDRPEGERSMARCVAAFNAITGKDLTEAEGWALMALLKMVRQWQNPDRYHEDSAVDGVNYAALMAEALSEQKPKTLDERIKEICENRAKNGKPDWSCAPYWAEWLAYDKQWMWFYSKPIISPEGDLIATLGGFENTEVFNSFGYSIHYMEPRP